MPGGPVDGSRVTLGIWINTYGRFDPSTPFGGFKQSGYGRELGAESLDTWTQVKSVWVDLAP